MGNKKVWILKNLRSIDNFIIEKQTGEDLNRYYCAPFKTEHWTIFNNYNSVSINLHFYPFDSDDILPFYQFDSDNILPYKLTKDTPLMLCPTTTSYGDISYVDFKLSIFIDNDTFKIESPKSAYNRNQYVCYLTENQINRLTKYLSAIPNDLLQNICKRMYNSRNEIFDKYKDKIIKVRGL